MIKVPDSLNHKISYRVNKGRFHIVEYTNATESEYNDVLLTKSAIVYIKQGCKVITINGEKRTIQSGNLFLATKGDYIMSEYLPQYGDFQSIMLFFDNAHIKEITANIATFTTICTDSQGCLHIIESNSSIKTFYQSIAQILDDKNTVYLKEILELKIRELIYILLTNPASKRQTEEFLQKSKEQIVVNMSQVLEDNIYSAISVSSLARLCNMSISTFKRQFNSRYGTAPMEWVTQRRLEKALQLLQTTDKQISDIAYECGFESYVHFARRFKAKYGESANSVRSKL